MVVVEPQWAAASEAAARLEREEWESSEQSAVLEPSGQLEVPESSALYHFPQGLSHQGPTNRVARLPVRESTKH